MSQIDWDDSGLDKEIDRLDEWLVFLWRLVGYRTSETYSAKQGRRAVYTPKEERQRKADLERWAKYREELRG